MASHFPRYFKSKGLTIYNLVFRILAIEIMVLVSHLLGHDFKMVHTAIHYDRSAIVHQESLVVEVVFKIGMLDRPDMVWTDIEKDPNIEGQAIDPFDQIGLARYLHNQVGHAICDCLGHHLKQIQTFRCG